MTTSPQTRAKTLGFRSLVVLGGAALAVTAVALPSRAATATGFVSDQHRLLDSRSTPGTAPGPVQGLVQVPVTSDVPTGAVVELTVTTISSTGSGYVVAYPDGDANPALPGTDDLNYSAGRSVSSTAVVGVPTDGVVDVYVKGAATQLVVDQQGYFSAGELTAPRPARIGSTISGAGFGKVSSAAGPRTLQLPAGDYAAGKPVALNVTVAPTTTAGGSLKTFTAGGTEPITSTVYFGGGLPSSNLVFAVPNAKGQVGFDVSQSANISVDLEGYAPAGSGLTGLTPSRVVDTRTAPGARPITGTHTLTVPAQDAPAGTTAVVLDLISTSPTGSGSIAATAGGTAVPPTVALLFTAGQTNNQTVVVPVSAGKTATVSLTVSGASTQVVVDTEGYLTTSTG